MYSMSEALFQIAGITVTITGVYAVVSILVLILFQSLWLIERKKKTGAPVFAGQVVNGAGFGLLPALAVLKGFQEMRTGTGARVFEPIPMIRWLTDSGLFRPGRIETAAAILGFLILSLWLIIRKKDLPDNGDLLMIAVCIWATIRLVTENLRNSPMDIFRYASCGVLLGCMIIWSVRRMKIQYAPGRVASDLIAAVICIALNIVASKGFLSVGSEIGDFAVTTGSAFLLLLLTLMTGGDLRRIQEKQTEKQNG